tara:strand:- start:364 stop:840 length:477 start_codon:yes stop_codon:yes gene_type:complete
MDCSAKQTIVKYRQLHTNVLGEQLADLSSDIIELGTTRIEKQAELDDLEKEINSKAAELGKTRGDIKKARKSLFGVIGGFGGMAGLVLVIVAVVFYIRYRTAHPRAAPAAPVAPVAPAAPAAPAPPPAPPSNREIVNLPPLKHTILSTKVFGDNTQST